MTSHQISQLAHDILSLLTYQLFFIVFLSGQHEQFRRGLVDFLVLWTPWKRVLLRGKQVLVPLLKTNHAVSCAVVYMSMKSYFISHNVV